MKEGVRVLRYLEEDLFGQGFNELLKGPTTISCDMWNQIFLWMSLRRARGDRTLRQKFKLKKGEFTLTQYWDQPMNDAGTKGNLLYSFYDLPPGIITDSRAPKRPDFLDYLSFQRDRHTWPSPLTDSWMDKVANYSNMTKRPNFDLGPLATVMPSPALTGGVYSGCPGWERSNCIYSQIADTSHAEASQALALSSSHYADMIFKAVINGWS